MTFSRSDLGLTTRETAALLSVHPSTVERWRTQGRFGSRPTGAGHRRIDLRAALELAQSRGTGTALDFFEPFETHVWAAVREAEERGSLRRARSLALNWLLRGHSERIGALFLLLGRHADIPLWRFVDEGIVPFLKTVGDYWAEGRLSVGDEHFASQTLTEVLLDLAIGPGDVAAPLRRGPDGAPLNLAVVGAAEGNRHHLGALAARLVLERRGWRVLYLGPDVPYQEFPAVQSARAANLVCISVTGDAAEARAREATRVLARFYDHRAPYALVLGAVAPTPRDDLDADPFDATFRARSARQFDAWLEAHEAGAGGTP